MSERREIRALTAVSSLLLVTVLIATMGLVIQGDRFTPMALFLVGFGLLLLAVAAVIGMLITRSRWAYLTAWMVLAVVAFLLIFGSIDVWWVITVTAAAATGAGLVGLGAQSMIRGRRSASGPPVAAVVVAISLASLPLFLGMASVGSAGWLELSLGVAAALISYWFTKTFPGALVLVRILWPVVALAAAAWMEPVALVVTVVSAAVTALAAWRPEVRLSVRPLTTTGSRVRIPPELAPREVLDNARLDDRGRPR